MNTLFKHNDPASTPPVFDATRMETLMALEEEGNGTMIKDIAQQFIVDLTGVIARMKQAISDGNYEGIAGDAHTVKGSAACFGLCQVEKIAKQLEASVKGARNSETTTLLASLEDSFSTGCDALNAFLAGKRS